MNEARVTRVRLPNHEIVDVLETSEVVSLLTGWYFVKISESSNTEGFQMSVKGWKGTNKWELSYYPSSYNFPTNEGCFIIYLELQYTASIIVGLGEYYEIVGK